MAMPETVQDKLTRTSEAMRLAHRDFDQIPKNQKKARTAALLKWNDAARSYFTTCVEAFSSNYPPSPYTGSAVYAGDWLREAANHYRILKAEAASVGLDASHTEPGLLKFDALQRCVQRDRPEVAEELKTAFSEAGLPTFGFDGIASAQRSRSKSQIDWAWFAVGCLLLGVAIVFAAWGFNLKQLSEDQRRILLWVLPLASGVAASAFAGSMSVRAHGLIPGLVITATSGFGVWFLTFFFLFPKPSRTQGLNGATDASFAHEPGVQVGVDNETFKKIIDRYERNLEAANLVADDLRKAQGDKAKIIEQLPTIFSEVQLLARQGDESARKAVDLMRSDGYLQPLLLVLKLDGKTNAISGAVNYASRIEQQIRKTRLADYCRWIDVASTGSSEARVQVVVFEDYQDPFSRRNDETLQLIRNTYSSNSVRICFLNNPLPFHANALARSKVAVAARRLGGFFSLRKFLYREDTFTDDGLMQMISRVGLQPSAFRSLLDDRDVEKRVHDEMTLALSIGASAVPSTIVDGQLVQGAVPFEKLSAVIDEALSVN